MRKIFLSILFLFFSFLIMGCQSTGENTSNKESSNTSTVNTSNTDESSINTSNTDVDVKNLLPPKLPDIKTS